MAHRDRFSPDFHDYGYYGQLVKLLPLPVVMALCRIIECIPIIIRLGWVVNF